MENVNETAEDTKSTIDSMEDIFKKPTAQLNELKKKSQSWFDEQAQQLQSLTSGYQAVTSGYFTIDSYAIPGTMILFKYLPKTRDKLPYWDVYPLVLPFGQIKGGFIGLNFHYLDYYSRVWLFQALSRFSSSSQLTKRTRLNLSWGAIEAVGKQSARECVHNYLYSQIRSPIRNIHPRDWVTALTLPWESFEK